MNESWGRILVGWKLVQDRTVLYSSTKSILLLVVVIRYNEIVSSCFVFISSLVVLSTGRRYNDLLEVFRFLVG